MRNRPFKLLQVQFSLDFTDDGHLRFGNNKIGGSCEAKLVVNRADLFGIGDGDKKGGIGFAIDRSKIFIEIYHVLILGV